MKFERDEGIVAALSVCVVCGPQDAVRLSNSDWSDDFFLPAWTLLASAGIPDG